MSSTYIFSIAITIIVIVILLRRRNFPAMAGWLKEAVESDDISGLVQRIKEQPARARVEMFQRAISTLWSEWHRPLAIRLIRAFAEDNSEEKICQYWMKQAAEVEPAVVAKVFEPDFWKAHYRPDVAKECGASSS